MAEFVNQNEARRLLHSVSPSNVLLVAPPGYGKTTLATMYLGQFGRVMVMNGTRVDKAMNDIRFHPGSVLIDEAHVVKNPEALYPMLDAKIEKGWLRKEKVKTFAFTTTSEGKLPGPLRSRLVEVALRPYSVGDLAKIAHQSAPRLPPVALVKVAKLSWGVPRRAKMLATLLAGRGTTDERQVLEALASVGYPLGLSYRQVDVLRALDNGSKSASTLAGLLGADVATIKVIESDLIRANLLSISSKGRTLTQSGEWVLYKLERREE